VQGCSLGLEKARLKRLLVRFFVALVQAWALIECTERAWALRACTTRDWVWKGLDSSGVCSYDCCWVSWCVEVSVGRGIRAQGHLLVLDSLSDLTLEVQRLRALEW